MDRAAGASPGGLLGVTGLAFAAIEAICRAAEAEVAIRIGTDAAVIGGPEQHSTPPWRAPPTKARAARG